MLEVGAALCWKGRFPTDMRPKKECIKPCETCFVKNALNFLIRVQAWNEFVSQSFMALWLCDPDSEYALRVLCILSIVWSLLPDNDWWALPVSLCKLNPIKAHWWTGSRPFSFWEISHLSSPSRSCLGRFILIWGWALCVEHPHISSTMS